MSKNVPAPLHGELYLGTPTPDHTFRLLIAFPIVAGDWVKLLGPMTWIFLFLLLAGLSVLGAVSASADEKLMGAGARRLSG